jgi:DNA-binding MarR family transcriptional regulator
MIFSKKVAPTAQSVNPKVVDAAAVELSVPDAISKLAISSQALVNVADTILRGANAGYGFADWALLQALSEQAEPQPLTRLSRRLGVTRQRIQRQMDQFLETGFISIDTSSEDKRVKNVALTAVGRKALDAISAAWTGRFSDMQAFGEMKRLVVVQRQIDRLNGVLQKMMKTQLRAQATEKNQATVKKA